MGFIALDECLRYLSGLLHLNISDEFLAWLYLPKAIIVALMLLFFRTFYKEISLQDLNNIRTTLLSVCSGVVVFLLWIKMDWTFGGQSSPPGFNPGLFEADFLKWLMIAVRCFGAILIVPIMEELFWRSFLLRYLIDNDFEKVRIGQFSLFSFVAVSLLFGLEHHYVFAGIMAGVAFNAIYYYSKSIIQCIVSHATANFCLAVYVLQSGQWQFW